MTTRVHIKRAMLAFPEFHDPGAKAADGSIAVNSAAFIIDIGGPGYKALETAIDTSMSAAAITAFGTDQVKFDKLPVTRGSEIKKGGRPVKSMAGKISLRAENIHLPNFYDSGKNQVGHDRDDLWYAGSTVYAIVDFDARESGGRKFLNAKLVGLMHLEHGTPLDRSTKLATADEFDV